MEENLEKQCNYIMITVAMHFFLLHQLTGRAISYVINVNISIILVLNINYT